MVNEKNIARLKNEISELSEMTEKEFKRIQDDKFSKLIEHFYFNKFNDSYKKLLNENGIDESNLPKSADELERLPVVTKDWLKEADYAERPAVAWEDMYKLLKTSGSTGQPLAFPHSFRGGKKSFGANSVKGMLRNGFDMTKGYFVTHWSPGEMDFSGSHEYAQMVASIVSTLIDENTTTGMHQHVQNILNTGSTYTASLSSFYVALANFLKKENLDFKEKSKLKYVATGGSTMTDENINLIIEQLGLKKFVLFYISSEGGHMGIQIDGSREYHIENLEYIVRILDEQNNDVGINKEGKVAITCMDLDSVPLINYKIGDWARYLGASDKLRFGQAIDNITRDQTLILGTAKVDYPFITNYLMPKLQKEYSFPIKEIQLVKTIAPDGLDLLTVSFETYGSPDQYTTLEGKLLEIINKEHFQLDYNSRLKEPEYYVTTKAFSVGELVKAQKGKLKIMVDASK